MHELNYKQESTTDTLDELRVQEAKWYSLHFPPQQLVWSLKGRLCCSG